MKRKKALAEKELRSLAITFDAFAKLCGLLRHAHLGVCMIVSSNILCTERSVYRQAARR